MRQSFHSLSEEVIGRLTSEWSRGDTIFQSNINPRLNYSEPSPVERGWEFNNKIIICLIIYLSIHSTL